MDLIKKEEDNLDNVKEYLISQLKIHLNQKMIPFWKDSNKKICQQMNLTEFDFKVSKFLEYILKNYLNLNFS